MAKLTDTQIELIHERNIGFHIWLNQDISQLLEHIAEVRAERDTPEIQDFIRGIHLETLHQRALWGTDHDSGKTPADWFWLVGYLAGKALHSVIGGNVDKAKHHLITTAAALCNWHAALLGKTNMRPGIEPPVRGAEP